MQSPLPGSLKASISRKLNRVPPSRSIIAVASGIILLLIAYLVDERVRSILHGLAGIEALEAQSLESSHEGFADVTNGPSWKTAVRNSSSTPGFLSKWWTPEISNNSDISFFTAHGTFWGPSITERGTLDWSTVTCSRKGQVDQSMALRAIQLGPASVRFIAPNGKVLAARGQDYVGADEENPKVETVFQIIKVLNFKGLKLRAWGLILKFLGFRL